jgi:hypothetical protein
MFKLGLWIGIPSFITFLASAYSQFLENIHFIFVLSVAALLVAIVPQLTQKEKEKAKR